MLPSRASRLIALLLFATAQMSARAADFPNVIVIFTDDQGYGDVGCYGAKGFTTPSLDQLAKDGTRFTNFHVAQAICTASRAALLTGCYPNRVSLLGALPPNAKIGLNPAETTIAKLVKQQGYATAAIGKWHLGDAPEFLPVNHGFDEYFGLPYSSDMWPRHPEAKAGTYPPLPLLDGTGVVNPDVQPADQEQLITNFAERAVRFIDRNESKPFFLYFAPHLPHVPLYVSDKFRGKSERGLYGDVMMEIDWAVGEILSALKRHGLDEKTLVIFTSDNGPWLSYGNHAGSAAPLREGKGTVWEGGTRVPCLMRWPGRIPANDVNDKFLVTIDLLPTIAHLAGAALPTQKIDGKNVWPLLTGEPGAVNPHDGYWFYQGNGALQAVVSGDWKLILPHQYRTMNDQAPGSGGIPGKYGQAKVEAEELYNLKSDPQETRNVIAEEPEVRARLARIAEQAMVQLGDTATKRKGSEIREPGRRASAGKQPN